MYLQSLQQCLITSNVKSISYSFFISMKKTLGNFQSNETYLSHIVNIASERRAFDRFTVHQDADVVSADFSGHKAYVVLAVNRLDGDR